MFRGRCQTCGDTFVSRSRMTTCSTCDEPPQISTDRDAELRREAVQSPQGRSQTVDIVALSNEVAKKTRKKKGQTLDVASIDPDE